MGWSSPEQYMFPEVRSLGGAILVLSLVLFPYVFLTARASFLRQSMSQLDVARTLGTTPLRSFFSIALPLARPAIAGGVGAGHDGMPERHRRRRVLRRAEPCRWASTRPGSARAIWPEPRNLRLSCWPSCSSSSSASARCRASEVAHGMSTRERPFGRIRIAGPAGWLAAAACFLPLLLGFLLPAAVLLSFALARHRQLFDPAFLAAAATRCRSRPSPP